MIDALQNFLFLLRYWMLFTALSGVMNSRNEIWFSLQLSNFN
jgi:hypothetical protein